MSQFIIKYITPILSAITIALILTGFEIASTVEIQTLKIEKLEKKVMNGELIQEKFKHINENFKEMRERDKDQDKKLDKILEKLN